MKKRIIGVALIVIGLFVFLGGRSITGNAIGFEPEDYINWLGIVMAVLGIAILAEGDKLESKAGGSKHQANIPEPNEKTALDYIREGNDILAQAGYDRFGRKKGKVDPKQSYFDSKMQTGAYSSTSGKHK